MSWRRESKEDGIDTLQWIRLREEHPRKQTNVQRYRWLQRAREAAESGHGFAFSHKAAACVHIGNQGTWAKTANPGV
jgi:hypothetical protein